jgi:hypothetical protein
MSTNYIETLEIFMDIAISQEYALFGAKLELVHVEWMKVRPTCTTKGTKTTVVRFFMIEPLKRGGEIKDFGCQSIDEICGSKECIIPIFEWHASMGKQG